MEACWSFKSLVGSSCGFDAKYRKRQNQIVPLVSCSKDISGPQNEIDLSRSAYKFAQRNSYVI